MITLDNGLDHTRPNTLGPRGLAQLNDAIDAVLARDDVAALAITGKPFILAAGADLSAMPKITQREQALAIGRIGHAVFDKLHTAPLPTFGFINGLALGGGLELPLHCDFRTVSAAAAGIGLPECFLGLFPGWGGTYLLPNLIGADRAVTVVIEDPLNQYRMLAGPQVFALGIADVLFDGADFWTSRTGPPAWSPAWSTSSAPTSTAVQPGTRRWPGAAISRTGSCPAPRPGRTAPWS